MSEPLVERLHRFFVRVFTTHDLFDKDSRQEMRVESFALDDKVEQLETAHAALKQAAKEWVDCAIYDEDAGVWTVTEKNDEYHKLFILLGDTQEQRDCDNCEITGLRCPIRNEQEFTFPCEHWQPLADPQEKKK